jgi:hypothetical protein
VCDVESLKRGGLGPNGAVGSQKIIKIGIQNIRKACGIGVITNEYIRHLLRRPLVH